MIIIETGVVDASGKGWKTLTRLKFGGILVVVTVASYWSMLKSVKW